MDLLLLSIVALLLDRWLGEPRRAHPLVGFGHLAQTLEGLCNRCSTAPLGGRLSGTLALALVALIPAVLVYEGLELLPQWLNYAIQAAGLYLCLGRRSLTEHARAVAAPLQRQDTDHARRQVARMVSRDSQQMGPADMIRATVESVLENANDACFATLFWFLVGGLPLAILHRCVNTLDAMWGYRTARYRYFGWAAARLDDLMGWLPARLGALSIALAGQTANALRCWRDQAGAYDSPNGGVIMACGAGALNIRLGGDAPYRGRIKRRPLLGSGREVAPRDIERAIQLVNLGIIYWLLFTAALLALLEQLPW